MSAGSSGAAKSGHKRVRVAFHENTAEAEVMATVNMSASTCAERLLTMQKAEDNAALVSAREERKARSARVFEGDAGLSEGVAKVKEQIKKLQEQLSRIETALAAPLPTGEVSLGGKTVSVEAVEVRRTAIKEELSRLEMAVSAISLKGPSMLALVRKLAAEGDVRGEIVPPRGSRPRGLLCEVTPEDTVVHHYVGSSLPKHLCMGADLGDPEDLNDEELDEVMNAGPQVLLPGPRPSSVRLALHASLEAALGAACDHDEIHLPPGTHVAGSLSRLRESITISGAGKDQTVLVNQPDEDYFVDCAAPTVTLKHLMLQSRGGTEGAVRVSRGTATLKDVIVDCGGYEGIRVLGGATLVMTGCVVSGAASAGVQVLPSARATLEQCVIANNGMGGQYWCHNQGGIQVHIQFSTASVDRQLLKSSPVLAPSKAPAAASSDACSEGAAGSSSDVLRGAGGAGSGASTSAQGGGSMLQPPAPRGTSLLAGGSQSPKKGSAVRPSILESGSMPPPSAPLAGLPAAVSAPLAAAANSMPPPPPPADRAANARTAAVPTEEPPLEESDPLKPAALLSLVGCKIARNQGSSIVFCMPRALLALGSAGSGVPEGACVWMGRGNTFEGPPARRYGFMAIEEQSMKAPKLQLTPRMTPIVTPAKLPALIPALALSPQIKRARTGDEA